MLRNLLAIFLFLHVTYYASAQISGTVFTDYNSSGTRTTTNPNEPLASGIIVTAYDASNSVIASYTTGGTTAPNYSIPASGSTYNGILGSNTGSVAAGTAVRLEFSNVPTAMYSGFNGTTNATSVQLLVAPSNSAHFAINNPADYNTGSANTSLFAPVFVNGNPLGGGTSGTGTWFVGFPYTNTGTTAPAKKLNGTIIGATWGVAYSKQAGKVFTSAFMKRHSGYGQLGSGGIYLLTPTATSFDAVPFFDMDNNAFNTAGAPVTRTRYNGTSPTYGNNNSFTLSNTNRLVSFNGTIDPVSGFPAGLGVIGTNVERGLPAASGVANYDGAAFDQVGKVGIGDIDISDDGKYLFVTNLYSRKVFRLTLDSATNPTAVIEITAYDLPSVTVDGVLRPFALKFYRDKLYVGTLDTDEINGAATGAASTTNSRLDAHVFVLNNPTGAASFSASPTLSYPLNYTRGYTNTVYGGTANKWHAWENNVGDFIFLSGTYTTHPQPMFADIEFNERGDMMMSYVDRGGHQGGNYNSYYLGGTMLSVDYQGGGDLLIAGYNSNTNTFTLESGGSYTSNGVVYSSGTANGQGPGGGEFFKNEVFTQYHQETVAGGAAYLQGSQNITQIVFDPLALYTGGILKFNTDNAAASGAYQIYKSSLEKSV